MREHPSQDFGSSYLLSFFPWVRMWSILVNGFCTLKKVSFFCIWVECFRTVITPGRLMASVRTSISLAILLILEGAISRPSCALLTSPFDDGTWYPCILWSFCWRCKHLGLSCVAEFVPRSVCSDPFSVTICLFWGLLCCAAKPLQVSVVWCWHDRSFLTSYPFNLAVYVYLKCVSRRQVASFYFVHVWETLGFIWPVRIIWIQCNDCHDWN